MYSYIELKSFYTELLDLCSDLDEKNIADYCPILLKMDQMKELFNDADRKKIENPFKVIADNIEKLILSDIDPIDEPEILYNEIYESCDELSTVLDASFEEIPDKEIISDDNSEEVTTTIVNDLPEWIQKFEKSLPNFKEYSYKDLGNILNDWELFKNSLEEIDRKNISNPYNLIIELISSIILQDIEPIESEVVYRNIEKSFFLIKNYFVSTEKKEAIVLDEINKKPTEPDNTEDTEDTRLKLQ